MDPTISINISDKESQFIQVPQKEVLLFNLNGKTPLVKFKMRIIGMNAYADMYIIGPHDTEIHIMTFGLHSDNRGFSYVFDNFVKNFSSKFVGTEHLIYSDNIHVITISRDSNFSITKIAIMYDIGTGGLSSVSYIFDTDLGTQIIIDPVMNFRNGTIFELNRFAAGCNYNRSHLSSSTKIITSHREIINSYSEYPVFVMESIIYDDTFDFHLMPVIECINTRSGEYVYVCAHIYLLELVEDMNGRSEDELWKLAIRELDIKRVSQYDCRVCVGGKEKYSVCWMDNDSMVLEGNIKGFDQYNINIFPYFDGSSICISTEVLSKEMYQINANIDSVVYGSTLKDMGLEDEYFDEDEEQ